MNLEYVLVTKTIVSKSPYYQTPNATTLGMTPANSFPFPPPLKCCLLSGKKGPGLDIVFKPQ